MTPIVEVVKRLHDFHDITRKTQHSINFGDIGPVKKATAVKQLKPILIKLASEEGWKDVLCNLAMGDKKWEEEFSNHLVESASGHYEGEGGVTSVQTNISLWVDIDCKSTQDENRLVLADTRSGRISKINYAGYSAVTSKNDIAAARFDMGFCRLTYDKTNSAAFWDVEQEDSAEGSTYTVRYFNTYTQPPWARASTEGLDTSQPPELIKQFFDHLFCGDPDLIAWVFGWLHYAQTSRAPTCPIMSGMKGTGKSIWNHISTALFAVSRPAPKNFFETNFNAPFLRGNEYCPIDEFPGNLVAVRKYMSKYQMVEAKGKDSTFTEISTNFSITGNPENVLQVQPDERIFSVLDITKKDLRTFWSEKQIGDFVKAFDPDSKDPIKSHWFHFIRNYTPQYRPSHVWKGARFSELIIEGLADWQAFLREECHRTLERTGPGGELLITKLRKEYRSKRQLAGSGGSLFSRDKTSHFLVKMAEIGDVIGTFVPEPKQHILVGINPLEDIGVL